MEEGRGRTLEMALLSVGLGPVLFAPNSRFMVADVCRLVCIGGVPVWFCRYRGRKAAWR
jgi:hypothetical protein